MRQLVHGEIIPFFSNITEKIGYIAAKNTTHQWQNCRQKYKKLPINFDAYFFILLKLSALTAFNVLTRLIRDVNNGK